MSIATSDWAKYIKERENVEVLETSTGFATYSIKGPECYIKDIWIHPDFRKQNCASQIADRIAAIAKEQGCKYLTGSVCPTTHNSTQSMLVLVGYGMQLHSSKDNMIYFCKELV